MSTQTNIIWSPQSVELVTTKEELELGVKRIERMGRICYQSQSRATEDSAKDFVKRITKMGHHSVLEHMSISFIFKTDRVVSHQLVRHRLISPSQESQRYCMYRNNKGVSTLECIIPHETSGLSVERIEPTVRDCYSTYLELLEEKGVKAEDARRVLPSCVKTQIGVTANLREWMHVFEMRLDSHAEPQIRSLMLMARAKLKELGYGWLFEA